MFEGRIMQNDQYLPPWKKLMYQGPQHRARFLESDKREPGNKLETEINWNWKELSEWDTKSTGTKISS